MRSSPLRPIPRDATTVPRISSAPAPFRTRVRRLLFSFISYLPPCAPVALRTLLPHGTLFFLFYLPCAYDAAWLRPRVNVQSNHPRFPTSAGNPCHPHSLPSRTSVSVMEASLFFSFGIFPSTMSYRDGFTCPRILHGAR